MSGIVLDIADIVINNIDMVPVLIRVYRLLRRAYFKQTINNFKCAKNSQGKVQDS